MLSRFNKKQLGCSRCVSLPKFYDLADGVLDSCTKRQNQTSVRNIIVRHGSYSRSITFLDSVTASLFQMQEVFQGYRLSGDAASKARVREATNAALKGLPSWPSPI